MTNQVRWERNQVVRGLLSRLEDHAPGERSHAVRVAVYACAIGERFGLGQEELLNLRYTAELHDIGKLSISSNILGEPAPLAPDSLALLKGHPAAAQQYLAAFPWLEPARSAISSHHERFDGSGYPEGKVGEQIPLESRIIAVAEVFDVLTMEVRYRSQITAEEAVEEMEQGAWFDPDAMKALDAVRRVIQPLGML